MSKTKKTFITPQLNGRLTIFTPYEVVDETNILDILKDALPLHNRNKSDILYLQAYRRGVQPVLFREKKIRNDIVNVVVKNLADQIVNFKTGYLLGEPIQFVARENANDDIVLNGINQLNNYCYLNKKSNLDKELAENMYTSGVGYRMVLPNVNFTVNANILPPFVLYNLDPATTSVVYYSGLGHRPLLSITEVLTKNNKNENVIKYCCYTDKEYFEITDGVITKHETHILGTIPVIEYPLNTNKVGGFEIVITLLDALNTIESNRIDAVEQTVQAIMVFYNLGMDSESLKALQDFGAISVSSNNKTGVQQDIKFLNCDLNQDQTQTLVNSLYQDILNICGIPNRNGGSSTSDTGSAVIMRDGWSDAEARAKQDELTFKASEIDTLELALRIWSMVAREEPSITVSNIDIRFTRRNYENIAQKTTVLTQLLSSDWIDPQSAFETCGLFSDPELAYKQGKEYHDSLQGQEPQEETIVEEINNA